MDALFEPAAPITMKAGDPHDELLSARVVLPPASGDRRAGPTHVALFGLPFDGAVIGRPGARAGPDAIRAELRRLKPQTATAWSDYGNVRLPRADAYRAGELATRALLEAGAHGGFPVALGGDHSLTHGLVTGVEKMEGKLGVINLDAHLDIREVHGDLSSGTPFRRLIDDGVVAPENLVEIGIREFANSRHYMERAEADGIGIHLASDVHARGPAAVAAAAVEQAMGDGVKGLYVSLDMDVLDESAGPGVSAPTPGGLDAQTLFALVRHISRAAPVLAMDVMEVAPPYDRDGMTARAAAYAILHAIDARGR